MSNAERRQTLIRVYARECTGYRKPTGRQRLSVTYARTGAAT